MAKKTSGPKSAATKHQSPKPNPFATKLTTSNNTSSSDSKKKKKSKLGPQAMAMKKPQPPKPNPFETIKPRRKFEVLGKKPKGEERRLGFSRDQGIKKRRETLAKEYGQRDKSSSFVDKRFGMQDETLDELDKSLRRRAQHEKLKEKKRIKYNLSDGEEDDIEFQGLGAMRDDFEDEMLPEDDEEDDGAGTARRSYQLNSGNKRDRELNDGSENNYKTDKERYAEMILNSKYHKAERAREKDENKDLMEELDKKFSSLKNKSVPIEYLKKPELSATQYYGPSEKEKSDDYDKLERELLFERRAQPSNRTKTAEEIAEEEREQLERLEEERRKRMLPADDSSDDDNEDAEKPSTLQPRSASGDDLGDSFSLEEEPRVKRGWVDDIIERKEASDSEIEGGGSDSSEDSESAEDDVDEGSDEDNSEGERNQLNDWEESDDDDLEIDLDEDEEDGEEHENDDDVDEKKTKARKLKKLKSNDAVQSSKREGNSLDAKKFSAVGKQSSTLSDLPFLIEAPKSIEELNALLDDLSNADIALIIHRIRASNAIKLAAENKKKMQVFYGLLLQYFATLANRKPLNLELLNFLVKPLMEMSMEIPYFATICARQRLLRTRQQFCEAVKDPENSCWPTSKTLFLLRLWSLIFPCSDFRHVVMTPAVFLICEYLARCPILSGRDVAVGMFVCSMLLSMTKQALKFCPEAVTFLQTLLRAAKEKKPKSNQDSEIHQLMEFKAPSPHLYIHESVDQINPLNFLEIMDLPEDSSFFTSNDFRCSVLVTVIETLRGYVGVYEGFSSFPEIFLPISVLLVELAEQGNMPNALIVKLKEVAQLIKTKADEHCIIRRPLQMRKLKPVPIKMRDPKIIENFVKGRDYDLDRERAEKKKLNKRVKQEAKGVVRELRKDNAFLHGEKLREQTIKEEERAEKYGQVRLFLQEQEHGMKSGQLGKGRKRRR